MRIQHRASYIPRSPLPVILLICAGPTIIGVSVVTTYLAVLASLTTP
jgi:hypothetical protein